LPDLTFRVIGAIHRPVYRLTGGRIGGKIGASPVLLLTTTGRKTGRQRTQPLLYAPAGDGYAVIASKGGADAHPLWFRNLQANPQVEVTIGRVTRQMRAREAEGGERDRLWRALADRYSGYDRYATRTSRRIPVVVLEPESD
jgi:deazaflavin-dependent oxidoreductase (nitroreductase family)